MVLVDDLVTGALLASAAFFVALSFGLLLRYRQMSQRISASSDLGRDLWRALEQRMKKQDERILDVMTRIEVIQSRAIAAAQTPSPHHPSQVAGPSPTVEKPRTVASPVPDNQPPESRVTPAASRTSQSDRGNLALDEMHLGVMKRLATGPKNTRQLTDAIGKSREHTARMMKVLFELGLVSRDDSTKPFVYQLTDEGRRRVSGA